MASPAKKQKKNDFQSSKQNVRSLNFYFSKQGESKPDDALQKLPPQDLGDDQAPAETDEELARRLQEEFDKEYEVSRQEPDQDQGQAFGSPSAALQTASPEAPLIQSPSQPVAFQTLSLQSGSNSTSDSLTSSVPLSDGILEFSPEVHIPAIRPTWPSESATYGLLVHAFTLINATASRIKIVGTLTNLLRLIIESDPDSLLPAVWLTTNAIGPPYVSMELGLGGSAISKALIRTSSLDAASLRRLYSQMGDPGDVAAEAKKRASFTLRKPQPLTIKGVYTSLVEIANSKGHGSQEIKQRIVERLLRDARGPEEARYLVRTLAMHLRIGAVKATMLTALARAFLLSRPPGATFETWHISELKQLSKEGLTEIYARAEELVKSCFAQHPSYATLVPALLSTGINPVLKESCGLTLHVPLRPMLGSITRDLSDMFARVPGREFTIEYKYDGQRAQLHCDENGQVSVFSRHLENMTGQYPDLVALMEEIKGEDVKSFILEGEVVAVDDKGEMSTFQTLAGRARGAVKLEDIKVKVCLFSFDLMYLNGESLLEKSLRERRELLKTKFKEITGRFTWVKNMDASESSADAVLEFFKGAVAAKCEGIMVKVLDNPTIITSKDTVSNGTDKATPTSKDKIAEPKTRRKALLATYEPDKRLDSWLKVKKDYHASSETLDLVPVAGWHGMGRKSAWWSPVLLAAYSPDSGRLVAVTKCISGFTDAFYIAMRAKYDPDGENTVDEKPSFVEYDGHPEVWFEPQEVWEIAFADITLSPTYTSAIDFVGGERGLSLRFPRFLKKREDKGIEEASTEEFLSELYFKQQERAPVTAVAKEEDDEEEE